MAAHDPLANLASRLPRSRPGTLFGAPLAALRDHALEQRVLLIAGAALLVSLLLPLHIDPTVFAWSSSSKFQLLVWPLLTGAGYLFVVKAPANLRQSIPPAVLRWLPLVLAFIGVASGGFGFGGTVYGIGYAILLFGLLARLDDPQDQIARFIIGVGAVLMIAPFIDALGAAFSFKPPALFIVHHLLHLVVMLLAVGCAVFVVKPESVPALRSVEAFAPLITAVLLAWLPVQAVLLWLATTVHFDGGLSAFLNLVRVLIFLLGYFAVLLLAAPRAYDALRRAMARGSSAPPGGPWVDPNTTPSGQGAPSQNPGPAPLGDPQSLQAPPGAGRAGVFPSSAAPGQADPSGGADQFQPAGQKSSLPGDDSGRT